MEINQLKQVKVNAKTLEVHVKVCDSGCYTLKDQDGAVIKDVDHDYVPAFMPGEHYGDYIILNIDIDTGLITNWKKPTAKDIESFASSGLEQ